MFAGQIASSSGELGRNPMDVAVAALEFHIVLGMLSPTMAECQASTWTDLRERKSRYFRLAAYTSIFGIDVAVNGKLHQVGATCY